uniref:Uncharacterized protein n=1 Tax=viral metagenome TaxID=1070528 RepID=A0A6M3K7U0_9ZZZZ
MDFTVEHDVYTFKYNKIIQGIDGKDVVITEHIENVTLKELQDQLAEAQANVVKLQAKINAIKAL